MSKRIYLVVILGLAFFALVCFGIYTALRFLNGSFGSGADD